MQKYREINGNDYVKDSRATINETMQSIQSMNSGTAFPTTNLFEGMKCYRTDLKKTYTLTDVENNTWVEDAHATLSDEATHAASATKLDTARSLNLGGAVTADAATFDGTANATINVKTLDATKLKGTASVSTTGNAATATKVVTTAATGASANIAEASMGGSDSARIRVSGAENAGELALETADDGDEAIVARQYTGIYEKVARTASILDKNGNTSFPGTVVAPNFTGSLNGNADTATKLQTARALSLTGKAAGSTTFDGSANASINVTSVNADTASKLSTARKINITGNASGAATFDGTSDVSINVSVSQAAHADNATNATSATKAASFVGGKVGGSWVSGMNQSNSIMQWTIAGVRDNSRYDPIMWGKDIEGNVWNLGWSAEGGIGFSGYKAGRTDNGTDGGIYFDPKTGITRGNFQGTLNGNADSATTATNVSGKIYYSADSPSVATDKLFTVKQAHAGEDNVPNNGLVIQSGPTGAAYNGKLYITDNGGDGVWIGGVASGKEVGWTRLVENKGSWNINSATATKLQTPRTISLTGNATGSANFDGSGNVSINTTVSQAANADTVDGIHATSLFYNKGDWASDNWGTIGTYQVNGNQPVSDAYGWGQVISSSTTDGRFQLYASHLLYGGNGRLHYRTGWDGDKTQPWNTILDSENYNLFAPTKTGGGASGTWGINISGNAASATNADKLDGYHASDLFRHLGGNQTPVITDIFDRAGTIDMTTMSAADKATHKANINKARNATQNIWNTDTGISAYGGDYDMANGYGHGSLKLTQSYKNFDKILVVGANDKGELLIYKLWDVWALANAFAGGSRFQLFHGGDYWFLYGSAKKGTWAGYVLSTDTVWSCQDENSGIVAIYGIKY